MPIEENENEKDDEDGDDNEEPSFSRNAITHTHIRTKKLST